MPWRELELVFVRMDADAIQFIDEVGLRIDTLQSAGHQERLQHRDLIHPELRPAEQAVTPSQRDGTHGLFEVIGINRHVHVTQEHL